MQIKKFIILFVIGLTIAGQLAGVIYLPSLPAMRIYFNSSQSDAKLILVLYLLGFGISQLFFGPYSDHVGRKKALLIGLVLSTIGNYICIVTANILVLTFSRILVGIGAGSTASVGRAILRDTFNDKHTLIKATSTIGIVTALTPAVGPALGGYLQQISDWRYSFLVLTAYSFFMLLVCMLIFKECNHTLIARKSIKETVKSFWSIAKNQSFSTSVLCASMAFSGLIAYEISAPFLFEEIVGLTPSSFGLIALFIAGSVSIGSYINKLLTSYSSRQRLKLASLFFIAAALILLVSSISTINVFTILMPSIIYATGVGIVFPTAISDALTPFPTNAGSASALFGFCQMTLTMIVNLAFSLIDVKTGIPLSLIFLITGFAVFTLTTNFRPMQKAPNI